MSTASPRPVFATLHTVKVSEVTQRLNCESKATFKRYLRIQLSSRSEKQSTERVVLDYTHVFTHDEIADACVYNLYSARTLTHAHK